MRDEKVEKWMKILLITLGIMFGGLFLTGSSYFLNLSFIIVGEGVYMDYLVIHDIIKSKRKKREVK